MEWSGLHSMLMCVHQHVHVHTCVCVCVYVYLQEHSGGTVPTVIDTVNLSYISPEFGACLIVNLSDCGILINRVNRLMINDDMN